jgi:hypothetical protein
MTIIYKYVMESSEMVLELPLNSKILTAQMQDNEICIWILRYVNEPKTEKIKIVALNTGRETNYAFMELNYINTCTSSNGIVWHVFQVYGEN